MFNAGRYSLFNDIIFSMIFQESFPFIRMILNVKNKKHSLRKCLHSLAFFCASLIHSGILSAMDEKPIFIGGRDALRLPPV